MMAEPAIMSFRNVNIGRKPNKPGKKEHPLPVRIVHAVQMRIGEMKIPLITHVNPRHSEIWL